MLKKLIAVVCFIFLSIVICGSVQANEPNGMGGIVCFTFDDGGKSIYDGSNRDVWTIMKRRSLPATLYVVSDYVGTEDHLSWEDLFFLHSKYGWGIDIHTKSHGDLTTMSDDAVFDQIHGEKEILESYGFFTQGAFAPPFGAYDARVIEIAKEAGMTSLRKATAEGEIPLNYIKDLDPWNLRTFSMKSDTKFEEVRDLVMRARDENALLILTTHPGGGYDAVSTEVLRKIVEFVGKVNWNNRLYVLTVSQAVERMVYFKNHQSE